MHGPAKTEALFARFEEVCDSFTHFLNFERNPVAKHEYKLERMRALLSHCANPEASQRFVHIAGSKGKGSTTLILQKLLSAQGHRVGQFTSPHIAHYRERIFVSNVSLHSYASTLLESVLEVEALAKQFSSKRNPPTMFELLTLTAFLVFHRLDCDIAVIETGLGGRLDTSNVITPVLSIITHLELEHTAVLGDSIEAIAFEKAGIIKQELPVLIAPQQESARDVLYTQARLKKAPVYYLPEIANYSLLALHHDGMDLQITIDITRLHPLLSAKKHSTPLEYQFSTLLLGEAQIENLALALSALALLKKDTSFDTLSPLLKTMSLPGRMQKIRAHTYIDGAHTVDSINSCLSIMDRIYPKGFTLLLACVRGKDSKNIVQTLTRFPGMQSLVISDPAVRASAAPDLKRHCKTLGITYTYISDAHHAFKHTQLLGAPVLCTGSFYLLAALVGVIEQGDTLG